MLDVVMPTIDELPPLTIDEIGVEQRRDDTLPRVRSWLDHPITPTPQELAGQSAPICTYAAMRENLFLRDNVLVLVEEPFSGFRVLVSHSLVHRVLELAHILGAHEGLMKLMCRLNRSFFWPTMRREASLFIATCSTCEKIRSLRAIPRSPLHPVRVGYLGEILAIDLLGGKGTLPVTPAGIKYILVMIDLFSRYVHAVALPKQSAQTVCNALSHSWVLRFGAARKILPDQGTTFESAIFSNFWLLWRIYNTRTTAYHPASNGACERVNQTIKHGLRKLLNQQNLND